MDANTAVKSAGVLPEAYTKNKLNRIVARFGDGRVMKGYTYDSYPNQSIHIMQSAHGSPDTGIKIQVNDLKAIFFVKDFAGNSAYHEKKEFNVYDKPYGRKIVVTFKDNEVLVGTTIGYTPDRTGFFLFPADAGSNNERVFVVTSAVRKIRFF
jgi:hypothetical protein